jgi:hypothetical protein
MSEYTDCQSKKVDSQLRLLAEMSRVDTKAVTLFPGWRIYWHLIIRHVIRYEAKNRFITNDADYSIFKSP